MFHIMLKYHDMETDITGTEESSVATWAEVLEIMAHIEIGAYYFFEVRDDQYRQLGYINIPLEY